MKKVQMNYTAPAMSSKANTSISRSALVVNVAETTVEAN